MSRIGIYTDIEGAGFKALVPGFQIEQQFGWTRDEAIQSLLPHLRDLVYRLRDKGVSVPRGMESLPPKTSGELYFVSI